jgi:sulfhydrogenase subunit gamma (sulfur reductase)
VEKGFVKFTVNRAGVVTTHLHNMKVGDVMGLRGPLGNWYPWEQLEGQKCPHCRRRFRLHHPASSIIYMLDPANRPKFGNIDVVYGARSPGMLLYKDELVSGKSAMTSTCTSPWMPPTIPTGNTMWDSSPHHRAKGTPGRRRHLCHRLRPPIMIKFTQPVLEKLGYDHDHIIMSLENRMKCGFGMCGRCGIGKELVCKDGPVFTLNQINQTPREY